MYSKMALLGLGVKGIEILDELIEDGLIVQTVAIDDSYKSTENSKANTKSILHKDDINEKLEEIIGPLDCFNFDRQVILICDWGPHLTSVLDDLNEYAKIITTIIVVSQNQEHSAEIAAMGEAKLDYSYFFEFSMNSVRDEIETKSEFETWKKMKSYLRRVSELIVHSAGFNLERIDGSGFTGINAPEVMNEGPEFLIGSGISDVEAFQDALKNYNSTLPKGCIVLSITGGKSVVDQSEEVARELMLSKFGDVDENQIFVSERRDMGNTHQVRIALLISQTVV